MVQTLYGLNSASSVSGISDDEKIATLDLEYDIDSQGSMMVYQVRDALNKYSKGNQRYSYMKASDMTLYEFESNISNSLTCM